MKLYSLIIISLTLLITANDREDAINDYQKQYPATAYKQRVYTGQTMYDNDLHPFAAFNIKQMQGPLGENRIQVIIHARRRTTAAVEKKY